MLLEMFVGLPIAAQLGLVTVIGTAVAKAYFAWILGVCTCTNKLMGKTVIITGANTGIGKETAIDLARRGARVIIACRDLKKASIARDEVIAASSNKEVIVKHLNLGSFKSVREFAANIISTESRLDILINNAGCALVGKTYTEDGNECQMQSNHFGHFLLTNLLLELMIKTVDQVRIINVSSDAHRFFPLKDINDLKFEHCNPKFFEIYCISKLCNILFTTELVRKLQPLGKNITVNSLHPGAVQTEFQRFVSIPVLRELAQFAGQFAFKTSKEGAQTQIHLAVSDELLGITGKYFDNCRMATTSKQAQDVGLAKKLWDISEEIVQLKPEERHF